MEEPGKRPWWKPDRGAIWTVVAGIVIMIILALAGWYGDAHAEERQGPDLTTVPLPIRVSGNSTECRIGVTAADAPPATAYRYRVRLEIGYQDRRDQYVPVAVATTNGQAVTDSALNIGVVLIGTDRTKLNRRPHVVTVTQYFEPFPGTEVQPPSTETLPIDPAPCQTT